MNGDDSDEGYAPQATLLDSQPGAVAFGTDFYSNYACSDPTPRETPLNNDADAAPVFAPPPQALPPKAPPPQAPPIYAPPQDHNVPTSFPAPKLHCMPQQSLSTHLSDWPDLGVQFASPVALYPHAIASYYAAQMGYLAPPPLVPPLDVLPAPPPPIQEQYMQELAEAAACAAMQFPTEMDPYGVMHSASLHNMSLLPASLTRLPHSGQSPFSLSDLSHAMQVPQQSIEQDKPAEEESKKKKNGRRSLAEKAAMGAAPAAAPPPQDPPHKKETEEEEDEGDGKKRKKRKYVRKAPTEVRTTDLRNDEEREMCRKLRIPLDRPLTHGESIRLRKSKMHFQKGTYLLRYSDFLSSAGCFEHIWLVDNHQLLQKFERIDTLRTGQRVYAKTDRYSGWHCDQPWLYYEIKECTFVHEVHGDSERVTMMYPSESELAHERARGEEERRRREQEKAEFDRHVQSAEKQEDGDAEDDSKNTDDEEEEEEDDGHDDDVIVVHDDSDVIVEESDDDVSDEGDEGMEVGIEEYKEDRMEGDRMSHSDASE